MTRTSRAALLTVLGVLGVLSSHASPARAEGLGPALVRLLDVPGRPHPLADASGRIPITVILPPGTDAAALGLLPVAPGIGAVRLPPEDVAAFAAAHPDLAIGASPPLHPVLDVSPTWTHVGAFRAATGDLRGKRVVVGVVDTGLDVAHPDFRDADGKTRVAWMLTGDPPVGLHPEIEARFGCTDPKQSPCAVYARADLDKRIQAGGPYPAGLVDRGGHGTHVTSIAAGNGGPSVTATPKYVGLAPEATLIFAAGGQNGNLADVDILNGTRFIFDMAASLCTANSGTPADPSCGSSTSPPPVVVNLSLGNNFGAHDGTSALEKGLSAFVGDAFPGRAIVVAAGNSGEIDLGKSDVPSQGVPSTGVPNYVDPRDGVTGNTLCTGAGWTCGVHTEVHVASGEETRVPIIAGEAMNGQGVVWITFLPGDQVDVGLEGPDGSTWVGYTSPGNDDSYAEGCGGGTNASGNANANTGTVVNDEPSADADIDPSTNSAVVQFTGAWPTASEFTLLLRGSGANGSGTAELWVTGMGDALGTLYFEKALRQGTITVPASAPGLLAVGCTINRIEWNSLGGQALILQQVGPDANPAPDSACFFSGDGPTPLGVQKPEISAPGYLVGAAMSAAADPRPPNPDGFFVLGCPPEVPFCAVLDEYHALSQGTSMSAPHVTGAIALLMELDPTLTQARATEVLQAGARLSHGHVPDPDQLGPGSLDLEGARQALLDTKFTPAAPDLVHSWWTLSSAYARPDPTWPVWGTVELRKNDDTLAGGVDGSELALSLTGGGNIYQALTRVRTGLWRFAVAGLPGDLGGKITVGITYAGQPIGEPQTLPVGMDAWAAADPTVSALSACAVDAPGLPQHSHAGVVLLLLSGLAVGARRRNRTIGRELSL